MLRLLVPEILAREVSFRLVVPDFLAAQGCQNPDGNSEATPHLSVIFAVQPISAHAPWVSAEPLVAWVVVLSLRVCCIW